MSELKDVLVFGEMDGSNVSAITTQLINIGKQISTELGQALNVIFLGSELNDADKAYCYGADKVYIGTDPLLDHYVTDSHLQAMMQVVDALKPAVILFGQNDIGLDMAPRLAFKLKVGVTLDSVDAKVEAGNKRIEFSKPVFGGKAHGHFRPVTQGLLIASIRQGAFEPAPFDEAKSGQAIGLELVVDPSKVRTRFVKKDQDDSLDLALKLSSASKVVCGGRGLKNQAGMDLILETARLIDGAVAGSRPAVENGWVSPSLQIGLTGKIVNPRFYFAIGVSGALQHMAGCMKSNKILAVNSDESAQIFKFSHFGAVGDFKEVLKGFNDEIKRSLG